MTEGGVGWAWLTVVMGGGCATAASVRSEVSVVWDGALAPEDEVVVVVVVDVDDVDVDDGLPDRLIDVDTPGHTSLQVGSQVGLRFPEPAGVLVRTPQ